MKVNSQSHKTGFTLLEMLVSILILGILTALISGNFLNSIRKGRDARRKADLGQVQKAIEMYYEDKKEYPNFPITWGNALCETSTAVSCGSEKTYMQKLPTDPLSNQSYAYYYVVTSSPSTYKLYSCLENSQDLGPGVAQASGAQSSYSGTNCGTGCKTSGTAGLCIFGIASPNTTL